MCIEREKVDFKSRVVNCLKECALALIGKKNQVILEYGIKNWKELPRNIKEYKRKDFLKLK